GLRGVERDRLLLYDLLWIREREAQGAGREVPRVPDCVVVLAMDVAVEDGHVLVGGEEVHDLVAVRGEPLPVGTKIEEGPVGEDHDRRGPGEAREIPGQPGALVGADLRLRA